MAKSREEIDEMIDSQFKDPTQMGSDQVFYEIRYIIEFILIYNVLGIATFVGIGALLAYYNQGTVNLILIEAYIQPIAFAVTIILGGLMYVSYRAGYAAFMARQMITAWTNKADSGDLTMFDDMRRLMDTGELVKGLFMSSLVTLLSFYLWI